MPTIRQCLRSAAETLAASSDSPALDADILLAFTLGCEITHLVAWPDREISGALYDSFARLVQRRREGTPIAYIKGEKEFWSRGFTVNEHTLIPRPETELLIEFILERFDDRPRKVIDLGTGSGAIAVTLACERPSWEITASDIDPACLEIAAANARRHGADRIEFMQADWLQGCTGRLDLIVSNPPYIAASDPHLSSGDLRFEPLRALASGERGLDDIDTLTTAAIRHLVPGGWLILEHGYDQKRAVRERFDDAGLVELIQLADLAGQPRMTAGRLP